MPAYHYRIAISAVLLALVCSFLIAFSVQGQSEGDEHEPGELVVKLSAQAPIGMQSLLFRSILEKRLGAGAVVSIDGLQTDPLLSKIRIARDVDLPSALEALREHPDVDIAEPNYIYGVADFNDPGEPNDEFFKRLWSMRNTGEEVSAQKGVPGADINVEPLWAEGITGDRKIVVAVLDTGFDWAHPDLTGNIYTNPGEIAGNGVDDDHNGFIDDVHGWNFVNKNSHSIDDRYGHGSHVSGIIGAMGNNGIGVAGVNWEVSILPVKFINPSGYAPLDQAIEAINYARMMRANVMNNSWSGRQKSLILQETIAKTRDAGVVFVAAAGNNSANSDKYPAYPASYPLENVISVAATDNQDHLAFFSNYGPQTVHVAAPGMKIYSTLSGKKYGVMSGTSMAAPHISGIAALMLAHDPSLTYTEIKDRLIRGSTPVPGLKTRVVSGGRVNAYNAVMAIYPVSP